jgi:hypothetical protein
MSFFCTCKIHYCYLTTAATPVIDGTTKLVSCEATVHIGPKNKALRSGVIININIYAYLKVFNCL